MEPTTEEVTLAELFQAFLASFATDLQTAMPCKVESYDASAQTVDVVPALNRSLPDGAGNFITEALPKLGAVPVAFSRSAKFSATFPLEAGDYGLLVFSSRNITAWRSTGNQGDAGDLGMHTLDGAVFVPGLYPDANPSKRADASNMRVGSETDDSSCVEITPASGGSLGIGATLGIARENDPVKIAAGLLASWMAQVETAINVLAPGAVTPLSSTFLSNPGMEIAAGSTKWKCTS